MLRVSQVIAALGIASAVHAQSASAPRVAPIAEQTQAPQPVEPAVADSGVLTMPTRQMPIDLAQPQGFDRVYQVPGDSGLFYRANGGLYAVFEQGLYGQTQEGSRVALAPAGLVYYIGKPDWSRLSGPSRHRAGSVVHEQQRQNVASALSASESDSQERNAQRSSEHQAETGGETKAADGSADASGAQVDPAVADAAAQYAPAAADAAAWAMQIPAGVDRSMIVGSGVDVRPRFIADFFYRQERLSSLFRFAVNANQDS